MKNTTTRPQRPNHPTLRRAARIPTGRDGPSPSPQGDGGPTPDPIQLHVTQRRLYTDFLALAMYPGMNPRRPLPAA